MSVITKAELLYGVEVSPRARWSEPMISSSPHARALGLTLVTHNTAEFEGVNGLTLENWTIPPRRKK